MCIFCEIIAGNIPSKKVYEDDKILAILDIAQTTKGHTLVIPKKHSDNFLQMDNDEFKDLMSKTQNIAKKLENKLLPADFDYKTIKGLRLEAQEKLNKIKPLNIGQASRISGVSPADISVLLIWLAANRGSNHANA